MNISLVDEVLQTVNSRCNRDHRGVLSRMPRSSIGAREGIAPVPSKLYYPSPVVKTTNDIVDDGCLVDMNDLEVIESTANSRDEGIGRNRRLRFQSQNCLDVGESVLL